MNSTEAAEFNVPRMLNAMKFMIEMSTKGIFLDTIGFMYNRYQGMSTQLLQQDVGNTGVTHEYHYSASPSIKTKFSGNMDNMAFCRTRYMGNIRGIKANLISYDYKTKEFAIKVEDHNNPIFSITHKIKPGDVPTDHIQDINDEAEMFQYSLTRPEVPDIVFDACRRMQKLIQISPQIDAMDFRMTPVIIDMEYKDLEAEFNRKQQGFCNF